MKQRGLLATLGPGLLFAAAAVGVSHLVQSTRAGANYGLALIPLVLLANLLKYPAFRFGPEYAAATGRSLLEGYRRQGRWALALYGLVTVGTMFTVQAAVTVVTAALLLALFGVKGGLLATTAALMLLSAGLLAVGRYHWLDRITKVLVAVLAISTAIATFAVLPRVPWSTWIPSSTGLMGSKLFLAALIGWMPSAIDVAVWQSLWTVAQRQDTGVRPTVRESLMDFHVGYIGTALLAVCFVLLGAAVMYQSGQTFPESAPGFAAALIALYVDALGPWSRPLIGAAASAVMFSTTLTVVDGFPRALTALRARLKGEEPEEPETEQPTHRRAYWAFIAVMFVGSMLVVALLMKSLKSLVDVATTLSFLTAPVLAVLNHRAICSSDVPDEARPATWVLRLSQVGILFLTLLAAGYVVVRFGS